MTRFQLASDLHIEAYDENEIKSENFIKYDPELNCDILILAGDIGRVTRFEQLRFFLKDVCSKFKIVLYVPGNQEYYKVDGMDVFTFDEINLKLKQFQKEISNLYILNRKIVIINDVCILGCTLWSDASIPIPKFIVKIPDMTSLKYSQLHKKDLAFIKKGMEFARSKKLKLLVISHHCPSFQFVQDFRTKYSSLYGSNLDYLFGCDQNIENVENEKNEKNEKNVHTWVFGHSHKNFDLNIKGTHFVSNQKGKGRMIAENFSENKIFEI